MKRSRHIRLVMMSTVPLFLTACDEAPTEVGVFRSVEECAASGAFTESDCKLQIAELQEQHAKEAPKFATREECVAAYGAEACQETRSTSTRSSTSSLSAISRSSSTGADTATPTAAPTVGPDGTTVAGAADPATHASGGGSFWGPMLAGYMLGRVGGFNQPVYGQAGSNQLRTSTGTAVTPGVQTVSGQKASALASTGRTSAAVSRGGFGSRMSSSSSS